MEGVNDFGDFASLQPVVDLSRDEQALLYSVFNGYGGDVDFGDLNPQTASFQYMC